MNPKSASRKTAKPWASRLSTFGLAVTWMLLLGSGQAQAGEVHGAQTLAPMVEKIIQSVVGIDAGMEAAAVSSSAVSSPAPPDRQPDMTRHVYGSGVIIKAEPGLIVTNNHLVDGAKTLSVRLPDGRQVEAQFVVAVERYDLAMLRISTAGLTAARIGRSIEAEPGDFVVAIGGPSERGRSVSFGIVSALHRSRPGIPCQDLIETDALLDRDSSGGPLFNLRGEVIGIVAAGTGESESGRSLGVAIPSDAIDRLFARMN